MTLPIQVAMLGFIREASRHEVIPVTAFILGVLAVLTKVTVDLVVAFPPHIFNSYENYS
jgi:hypothetical protein